MAGILAIETATDACSVAVYLDGVYRERHEQAPRQHSQRLFGMLRELLPDGDLAAQGIEAIAYGCGPGSFTGLRIAASAVQGLAFANALPAIAVSTLVCQAQTAFRLGIVGENDRVFSTLDARINELYCAVCEFDRGLATVRAGPWICAPAAPPDLTGFGAMHAVGSGCRYLEGFPVQWQSVSEALLPAARDLIPLAGDSLQRGHTQRADQVHPVYVRDEISWKKLSEQGKRV